MNLSWRHVPLILLAGVIGAGLGALVAFAFKSGVVVGGSGIGTHWVGVMWGSIVGVGFAVVTIVVRAARDPNIGPARYFMRINGMGSTLIGHSEAREDGSYATTEWFTLLWIPIFPVCRYRVTKHEAASTPGSTPYTIHEKMPVRL